MPEVLNIYQKLAKIRKPVEIIKKNRRGYGYTYVDEEMILSKITGLMARYGVSLIPNIMRGSSKVEPYHYLKTKFTKDGVQYDEHVNEVLFSADMEWHWVNNDNPDDRVIVPWTMVGCQADASQSFGSGLTYSSRYFLLKYFNVATSDNDPDEYRKRQKEAENEEDRLIAEQIIEGVHNAVLSHLANHPDDGDKIKEITKKYAKNNGKASVNYYVIKESAVATALKDDLTNNVFNK